MKLPAIDRFMNYALPEPNSGCWLWMAQIKPNGYGAFYDENQNLWYAHRYSYTVHKGAIPSHLVVHHKCSVRSCVNPDHLEIITQSQNVKHGIEKSKIHNKSKTHCPYGHEYTNDNILLYRGGRYCRACKRIRESKYALQ